MYRYGHRKHTKGDSGGEIKGRKETLRSTHGESSKQKRALILRSIHGEKLQTGENPDSKEYPRRAAPKQKRALRSASREA